MTDDTHEAPEGSSGQPAAPAAPAAPPPRATWAPEVDEAVAHRLHLCGLARPRPWWVAPAYARQDGALRRQAKRRPAPLIRAGGGACDARWALGGAGDTAGEGTASAAPADDRRWFAVRWGLGDRLGSETAAARVAREAAEWGATALVGPGPVGIVASAVVAGAVAHAPAGRCAVGLTAPSGLAVLAWIAARLAPHLGLPDELAPHLRHLVAVHTAATLWLREGELDQRRTEVLLETAGRSLLPARGDEDRAREAIRSLVGAVLDQPPGEVGRITSGWHRGRTDRLHRAWERGFFVPRGRDPSALRDALRGAASVPS